ncbi:hypothetical protein [Rhodoplanes roseus]|uniref:Uncharacterized protein n=1 Tax=Rhodoplanes roseus TaxID=29409 RepID=A0A327L2I6_9BRAD|nr:hypothetical protein [Rhodoplanes roseus]RAI44706.1 hypothetical protein CH341_07770 [Rhodoplanes roseus]
MPRITNHTRQTLDFVIPGKPKDGVPPTASVRPGETADIDVREDDPVLLGRIAAGAVSVDAKRPSKAATGAPA